MKFRDNFNQVPSGQNVMQNEKIYSSYYKSILLLGLDARLGAKGSTELKA